MNESAEDRDRKLEKILLSAARMRSSLQEALAHATQRDYTQQEVQAKIQELVARGVIRQEG